MPVRLSTILGAHEEVYFVPLASADDESGDNQDVSKIDGAKGPYKFGPFSQYDKARCDRLLERISQSPLEAVADRLHRLPEAERGELWSKAKTAAARWEAPTMTSMEGHRLLTEHPDGSYDFFRIAIQSRNTVDDAEIDDLWKMITPRALGEILRLCVGLSDPKAQLALLGDSLTDEEKIQLTAQSEIADRLSMLRSPFRWISDGSLRA